MDLKPIETSYNGYRFRSRLEARWAVFFDTLGIEYDYEPEGYGNGILAYLPDFWLPQVDMWAEVKPRKLNSTETRKAIALVKATRYPLLMLIGPPDFINYHAIEIDPWNDEPSIGWDYALITKMIVKGERRFPCANFLPDNDPQAWGMDYNAAVMAARAARFEDGRKAEPYQWTIT